LPKQPPASDEANDNPSKENTGDTSAVTQKDENLQAPLQQTSNLSAEDLSAAGNDLQTPVMEVHAHHHRAAAHGWRQYLFDFLMLFLAVTAGFFVENMREHYIEKHRLHQYLQSMTLDVDRNITALDSCMKENSIMVVLYDSLVEGLMRNPAVDRANFARTLG